MAGILRDTLPLGLGIALNPIAIVAGILILSTAGTRVSSLAFTIGWVLGLFAVLIATAILVQARAQTQPHETRAIVVIGQIVCGIVLIAISLREVLQRPPPGEERPQPRWMRVLDHFGAGQSLALGLFLAMASLKNLVLAATAASLIGQAGLGTVWIIGVVTIFVAISSVGVLVPLLIDIYAGEKADSILDSWRSWLERHAALITAVVMTVLGIYLISKGVSRLP